MTRIVAKSGRVFEVRQGMVEVTSNHRPDPSWRFTDAAGHEHRWHVATTGQPAETYRPDEAYDVPTLVYVEDYPGDDEYPPSGHFECRACRARVQRGFTMDDCRQFVPGLRHCLIDGASVSGEEFERAWKAEIEPEGEEP